VRAVGGKHGFAPALVAITIALSVIPGILKAKAQSDNVPVPVQVPVMQASKVFEPLAPARPLASNRIQPTDRVQPNSTASARRAKLAAISPQATDTGHVEADNVVKQGEVLKVRLHTVSLASKTVSTVSYVTLAGQRAPFYAQQDGDLLALLPVSVFQKAGSYQLDVYDAAHERVQRVEVRIEDGHYKTQNVTVSKTTEGLKPLPGELEAIQALKDTQTAVQYWNEPFVSPTPDCQNSPFGVKRLHNGVPTGDYHKGVDLRSPQGRPIRATAGGKIRISRMYRLHGGTVGIDHGQGVESIYIHMSKLNVAPGEMVKKGDVIGFVGSTGFATGPHLHWGMYVNGLPVNPNQWIANVPLCR
jgi:murein DD-endopeptidase MepM/ murein hydrolase activator NlpD